MSTQTRSTIPDINVLALQNARLAEGISKEDLAKKLCLSVHHIDELEANELKLFFSHRHRYLNALRLGQLLGLSEEAIIKRGTIPPLADQSQQSPILNDSATALLQEAIQAPMASSTAIARAVLASEPQSDHSNEKAFFTSNLLGTRCVKWILLLSMVGLIIPLAAFYGYENEEFVAKESLATPDRETLKEPLDPPKEAQSTETSAAAITASSNEAPKANPVGQGILAASEDGACSLDTGYANQFTPRDPLKPANFVFIVASRPASLCVKDSQGKITLINITTNESRIIGGQAPFTVLSNHFDDVQIFFQGRRVTGLLKTSTAAILNPVAAETQ